MVLQISHTHTLMNIHIQNQHKSNAYGLLPTVGDIMGFTLLSGNFQNIKNDRTEKIT
jgi:hypothetical protein